MDKRKYDLFLSYSHLDAEIVQSLASELSDAGIEVWFDQWELVPGEPWEQSMKQAIAESSAVGICIGRADTTRWVEETLKLVSPERQGEARNVIPILLADVDPSEVPAILRERVFIHFRNDIKNHEAISKLISSIKGGVLNTVNSLHNAARLAQTQGELAEARRLYNESLEIAKRLGNQSGIASTLHQLAMLAQVQGEMYEARRLYDESLEIAKRLGDQSGIAITLHNLGWLAQDQGQMDEARRLYGKSLEIKKRLGNQSGIAITLGQLGRIAEKEGRKVEASRLFREALSIFEKLGSPYATVTRQLLERVHGKSS